MPEDLPAALFDTSDFAAAGFLARYREPTSSAYRQDLRCFWQWCADHPLTPARGQAPAPGAVPASPRADRLRPSHDQPTSVHGRRSVQVRVIDELVASNPTQAVTRPHVPWESQHRMVLHPLEFAAVLTTARQHSRLAHALVALLGMLGLRVSEACSAQIADLTYVGGYEVLHVLGKGAKPPTSPCPSRACVPSAQPPRTARLDQSCSRPRARSSPEAR